MAQQNGESTRRATASSWSHTLLQEPRTVPVDVAIPASDLEKLLRGFVPEQMEDRWFCFADGPDATDRVLVHICRSWTGLEQYMLEVHARRRDDGEWDGATITKLSWPAGEGAASGEADAKEMASSVCNWLMGSKFVIE